MKRTVYNLESSRLTKKLKIALVSDLHDRSCDRVLALLRKDTYDIIAVTGDLTSRLDCAEGMVPPNDYDEAISHENAFSLLREAAKIAPTYYSLGNHELCGHKYKLNFGRKCLEENMQKIKDTGAILLDDEFTVFDGIRIGGLTSGMTNNDLKPKLSWLEGFAAGTEFRLLLCHHPEYYVQYLEKYGIDLVLSGHAHGGQIRLFGRGLYAPGQGVLPKYTSGVCREHLVVSRGLCNTVSPIPRLFNPTELVIINVSPKN